MAGSFSVSGLGSNIDFSVLTDSIINSRSAPVTQMANKRTTLSSRVDALKQLNSKLLALKDAANGLTDRTTGSGRSATSSNANVISATSSATAANGALAIQVARLAGSLSQASDSFTSDQSPVLAGAATAATFTIYKGGVATDKTITIDSTDLQNNTLAGLRDAINAADAGVTAAIVDVKGDGTGNQLVLNSTATGAAGRVELVETTGTGTDARLNLRTLNPPSGDFSDLDAELKINGLTVNRPTNSFSDAISGITFTLKDVGAATVTVAADSGALKSKIAAFADAYNAVQDFISAQYKADADGKPVGVLASDATLRAAQGDLRNVVNSVSNTNGGAFSGLAQIGISRDENGRLKVDQEILNDRLKNALSDVQALFAGKTDSDSGLASSLVDASSNMSGYVQTAITGFDASIDQLSKHIADQQTRLSALRDSLTRQFAIADAAIGQLNGQNTSLTSILKSLEPKSS